MDLSLGDAPVTLQSGSTFPSQFFSVKWIGYLEPLFTETYRLYLFSHRTAQFKLTLGDAVLIENNFDLSTIEESTVPNSAFFASDDIDLTAGELNSLELAYGERLGQTTFSLYWESDSQEFGKVPSIALYHTLNSEETPYTFTVIPAATNETQCHLYDTVHTAHAIVNVEEVHTVYARDVHGNLQINNDDVFTATVSNDAQTFTGTVTTLADATYEIRYTVSVAGDYTLEIKV